MCMLSSLNMHSRSRPINKLAATQMAAGPSASLGSVAAQKSAIDAESTDKSLDQLDMLHTEKRLKYAIVLQSYVRMWRVRRKYALEAGAGLRPRAEGREETTEEVRPKAVESRASEVHQRTTWRRVVRGCARRPLLSLSREWCRTQWQL